MLLRYRKVLKQKYFSKRHVTDTKKLCCLTSRHPPAMKIVKKLMAAGEAVKKGYLDEISLVITEKDQQVEAIEVHSFKFEYASEGRVFMRLSTTSRSSTTSQKSTGGPKTSTTEQLESLIKVIHYLCDRKLLPLPAKFSANFRIKYTESAPDNFSIDGFNDTPFFYSLPENAKRLGAGVVFTNNHRVSLICRSVYVKEAEPVKPPKEPRHPETSVLSTASVPTARRSSQMDPTQKNVTSEERTDDSMDIC